MIDERLIVNQTINHLSSTIHHQSSTPSSHHNFKPSTYQPTTLQLPNHHQPTNNPSPHTNHQPITSPHHLTTPLPGPHPGSPQQHPLRLGGHSARRGLPDSPLWPWRQRLHQQPGQRATHGAAEPERSRWTPGLTKGDAGGAGWWWWMAVEGPRELVELVV